MSGDRLGGEVKLVSSLTPQRLVAWAKRLDRQPRSCRWGFDPNGDMDLRRATRLTVRDGDVSYLGVGEVDG